MYGALSGFARNAAATSSASCAKLRVRGRAGRRPCGVRGGAQHALRQRCELARLRDGDADRGLGHVIAPGDHRRDAGERSGGAGALEGTRGGGGPARSTVAANVGEGWRFGYWAKTPVERVLRAVGHAARRRPCGGDELLGGLRRGEHADALAHHDPPVDGSEEHTVARRRAGRDGRVDPGRVRARLLQPVGVQRLRVTSGERLELGAGVRAGREIRVRRDRGLPARTDRHGRDQDGGGHDRAGTAGPLPHPIEAARRLPDSACVAQYWPLRSRAMRSAVGGCVLNRLANSHLATGERVDDVRLSLGRVARSSAPASRTPRSSRARGPAARRRAAGRAPLASA